MTKLSMMQQMSIHDDAGRCRCPHCGRFRRETDFAKQPGHVPIVRNGNAVGHVHVAPMCNACLRTATLAQFRRTALLLIVMLRDAARKMTAVAPKLAEYGREDKATQMADAAATTEEWADQIESETNTKE